MNLKKFISGVSALTIAVSAFAAMTITASAAGYTRTLTDQYAVKGYVADTLYNFQTNTPEVLPTDESSQLRYRDGGIWGLHNFGSGARSAEVSIPVEAGQIIIFQAYSGQTITSVSSCAANAALSDSSKDYYAYSVTADADSITISVPRYSGVVAALTMSVDPDAPAESLAVEYKSGNTVVYTDDSIDIAGKHVGDTMTVPFRAYVQDASGNLYQTTKNGSNPWYGDSVTLAADTVVTKAVTPVAIEGTVEFFEDFDGSTANNADIRASYGAANDNTYYKSTDEIPAGVYTFIITAMNKGRNSNVVVGVTTVLELNTLGKNAWNTTTVADVTITEAGNVELTKGGSNTVDPCDVIIAIKTADITPAEPVVVKPTLEAAQAYVNEADDTDCAVVGKINVNISGGTYVFDRNNISYNNAHPAVQDLNGNELTDKQVNDAISISANDILVYVVISGTTDVNELKNVQFN